MFELSQAKSQINNIYLVVPYVLGALCVGHYVFLNHTHSLLELVYTDDRRSQNFIVVGEGDDDFCGNT